MSGPACAQALTIDGAWARATAPHQQTGAVYLTLHAGQKVSVVSVTSTDAQAAMLHRTTRAGGMASMQDVGRLDLAAGETLALAPGGLHVMLMGLHHGLVAGGHTSLSIGLSDGTSVRLDVPVQPIGAQGPPG